MVSQENIFIIINKTIFFRSQDPLSVCDSVVLMIEEMEVKTQLLRREVNKTLKLLKVWPMNGLHTMICCHLIGYI